MKKLFAIVAVAAIMTACNEEKTAETTTTTDSLTTEANKMADTASSMMNNMADSAKAIVDTAAAKMQIMTECGIHVVSSPADIGKKMAEVIKK